MDERKVFSRQARFDLELHEYELEIIQQIPDDKWMSETVLKNAQRSSREFLQSWAQLSGTEDDPISVSESVVHLCVPNLHKLVKEGHKATRFHEKHPQTRRLDCSDFDYPAGESSIAYFRKNLSEPEEWFISGVMRKWTSETVKALEHLSVLTDDIL